MGKSLYYDPADILADEILVPASFSTGVRGLGKVFDSGNAEEDVLAGSRFEIPLWLALTLSQRNIVELRLPRFYNNKMQRKMEVGAGCEDLRARCPHFYEVACKLFEATGNEDMGSFVNHTFRARYKELLTTAHSTNSQGITALQSLLSQEELHLCNAGRFSVDRFDRWRRTGDSILSFHVQKRRSTTSLQDTESLSRLQTRQRQQ